MKLFWAFVGCLSIFSFSFSVFSCAIDDNIKQKNVDFISVVDGDTIKVKIDSKFQNIRILGIDTPETYYQGKYQNEWAFKAKEYAERFFSNTKKVTLILDEEKCDHYGRVLAYVRAKGQDYGDLILSKGLAVNYCIFPNIEKCGGYSLLAKKAFEDGAGMFSGEFEEESLIPYLWRMKESHRSPSKWVGDFFDFEVLYPDQYKKITFYNRIFFQNKNDIHSPYYVVH